MSPDPYQEGTIVEIVVGSSPSGKQSSEDYEWFYDHYAPIFPDDVLVDVCDGNSEAMWAWSCRVPPEWLEPSPPFVREGFRPQLKSLIGRWIAEHNAAISRIPAPPDPAEFSLKE